MTIFLKFSFIIINISQIKNIYIQPDYYCIHLCDNIIKGNNNKFSGFGEIKSENSKIEIYKKKNPDDYITMKKWIDDL